MAITYEWRADFGNQEVNVLHAEGFDHPVLEHDWRARVEHHSLGWVCARDGGELVGFVNVAWDGADHAYVVDTLVSSGSRRKGIGTRLVGAATEQARSAGCAWLHVDFEDPLRGFYVDSCGFAPTNAGLVAL